LLEEKKFIYECSKDMNVTPGSWSGGVVEEVIH
jgi:hypothetical protein